MIDCHDTHCCIEHLCNGEEDCPIASWVNERNEVQTQRIGTFFEENSKVFVTKKYSMIFGFLKSMEVSHSFLEKK